MVRRKGSPQELNELVAKLETCNLSYSISDYRLATRRLDDEALIEATARVDVIGAKHAALVGSPLLLALGCARSYSKEELPRSNGLPTLFSLSFKRDHCSSLAYLPSEVFWGLCPMLLAGQLGTARLTYDKPHYGRAELITLAFE
jgi:hypothetical protein